MIKGLYIELADMIAKRDRCDRVRQDPTEDCGTQHTAAHAADTCRMEIPKLQKRIAANEAEHQALEGMIIRSNAEQFGSRLRSLYVTKLEEASNTLRRELGDKSEPQAAVH